MKSLFLPIVVLLFCSSLFAQLPALHWANKYGGSEVDIPFTIKFTADGGTIAAGYTDSQDGDVSNVPTREYWDLWVAKLDRCGNLQWEKVLGGSNYETARDIEATSDGGYIVVGETNSSDGGVVSGFGGTKDIWLLKLDANGNLSWQKRFGGNGLDIGNHIHMLSDGSFYILASSSSNDGDITGNHGTGGFTDGVIMKFDAGGNLQWSRCYGGSKNEELLDMEVINNRMYVSGYANSTDGDIPPSQKNYDVWLLALDMSGNKIYSKVYGGSQNDVAYSMTRGNDGTLTLAGYTTSNDGMVSGAKGGQDYWVVNINTAGNLVWQKDLGGSDAEYANSVITDYDGGYIVGGISYSSNGDISNPLGEGDYWVVKLDAAGTVLWKQNLGGSGNDHLRFLIHQPANKEYYLAGDSDSGDGEFNNANSQGETDFGIIKLKLIDTLTRDSTVCSIAGFVSPLDTLRDFCGYDSVLRNFRPVLLNTPFDSLKKIDTIFEGETYVLPSNGNATITWNADPTLSCSNCPNPTASPTVTTVYTATNALAMDCQKSDQFTLVVLKDALVMVPSAFTPNGDGLNDWFGALGKVPGYFSLQVFNRYGEMVFQSSAVNTKWNGRYKGILQPNGVFVYIIKYRDRDNRPFMKKGTVTLIK
jgi:gliding motility-associated-like protein